MVGSAVSAAGRTPLEETSSGEFVTGRDHIFVIRLGIVSRVARQIFEILSFSQDCLGDPIGDTSYTMENASRVEELQEGIDEEVEQEGGKGKTLYRSRVQLDRCGGLTAHLNSHRRVFINAAE